jgi:hypothetical protein
MDVQILSVFMDLLSVLQHKTDPKPTEIAYGIIWNSAIEAMVK